MKKTIVLIGAGNVATRLGHALAAAGHRVAGVCTRGSESGACLAESLGCEAYADYADVPADADFVIISTTDAAVPVVAEALPRGNYIVAHTSGSVPLSVISGRHSRAAVIYPLQTFSKDVDVDVSEIPFFTEACGEGVLAEADALAASLSGNVFHADTDVRARLHVAGVLSCNFPVYLLDMTRRVLSDAGLPLDVVAPLVRATVKKTFAVGPLKAMTGPARRGDLAVVKKQLESLGLETDRDIYRALSVAILKEFHPEISDEL